MRVDIGSGQTGENFKGTGEVHLVHVREDQRSNLHFLISGEMQCRQQPGEFRDGRAGQVREHHDT